MNNKKIPHQFWNPIEKL